MQEKGKLSILLEKELNFRKIINVIIVGFCIAFFSTIIMYMFGLLSQLIYPGMLEIWVGIVCLSTMFGFALSNFFVTKEQEKLRDELSALEQSIMELSGKEK